MRRREEDDVAGVDLVAVSGDDLAVEVPGGEVGEERAERLPCGPVPRHGAELERRVAEEQAEQLPPGVAGATHDGDVHDPPPHPVGPMQQRA